MSPNEIDLAQAEEIVKKVTEHGNIKVLEHNLKAFSNDKVGFLGTHHNLQMKLSNGEVLTFFVKSLPQGSSEQIEFVEKTQVFDHEAEYFNKVMPEMQQVTSSGDVEDWAPKCYLANRKIVILENLKAKGFSMSDKKVLEGEELKSAVKTMARLHAASVLVEKKLNKTMKELYPKACYEQLLNEYARPRVINLFEALIKDLAEKNDRPSKNIRNLAEYCFDFANEGNDDIRVLNHGDAWLNNIMLDSSSPPKCRLVDYQMTRYAPRMLDVAEFMYSCTNAEIRQEHERNTIESYWREFNETMRKCKPEVERPSFEEILKEYEAARATGLMIALLYYPTILLPKNAFLEHDPDVFFRKFVFRDNNDCIMEVMERDNEYKNRITEAALEFIQLADSLAL